jgi:hypothetical protein
MRSLSVLYAEDRDLIPSRTDEAARALYSQGYSVRGLRGKLLEDQARHPGTIVASGRSGKGSQPDVSRAGT